MLIFFFDIQQVSIVVGCTPYILCIQQYNPIFCQRKSMAQLQNNKYILGGINIPYAVQ